MPITKKKQESAEELPRNLRPFDFHGVDLAGRGSQKTADCPFCGREGGKWSVNEQSGLWQCKVCLAAGNPLEFIRQLHAVSAEATSAEDEAKLAAERQLLFPSTVREWGACLSVLSGEWLIPGHGPDGKIKQLYRRCKMLEKGKWVFRLLPTPGLWEDGDVHGLHGVNLFKEEKGTVLVCEGPWDGMALWEMLRRAKPSGIGDKLSLTSSEAASLLADASVLAVPGAGVFKAAWMPLLAGKRVVMLYDNDHRRQAGEGTSKRAVDGAGLAGMRRMAEMLATAEQQPDKVEMVWWGAGEGQGGGKPVAEPVTESLPSGFDVRDHLSQGKTAAARLPCLESLLAKARPIPADWVQGRGKEAKTRGSVQLECLPCKSWKVLVNAWRKAMDWIEGLDRALSCMLASVASVNVPGDQLWLMVVSPASCLHGDTVIFDPLDGSSKTVEQRHGEGKAFFVWTKKADGTISVSQAMSPQKFPAAAMYEIEFASGKKLRITGGHLIWDQKTSSYVSVLALHERLLSSGPFRVQSISERTLSIRQQDVLRSTRTVPGFRCDYRACPCSCGELPQSEGDTCRCDLPSRGGVQGHILPESDRGDLEPSGRCIPPQTIPCSCDDLPQSDSPILAGSRHSSGDGLEQSFSTCRWSSPPEKCSCQQHTDLGFPESFLRSEGASSVLLQHEEHSRCGMNGYPESSRRLPGCTRSRIDECIGESSPSAIPCGTLAEVESQREAGISECSLHRLSFQQRPRSVSSQIDTVSRPADDVPESTQQPSEFLQVRVNVVDLGIPILSESDEIVNIKILGEEPYYDFHVPVTNNYWAEGFFHHNTGKTCLCEALSVNRAYTYANSKMKAFHSGWKTDAEGEQDHGMIPKIAGKTLITKDGDTLLSSPSKDIILSEGRDLYDSIARSTYLNGTKDREHNARMTWLLCGTESLRSIDRSELGERFLKVIIMEGIDLALETGINLRKFWQTVNNCTAPLNGVMADGASGAGGNGVNGVPSCHEDAAMVEAKRLTGGYVGWLRENILRLLAEVTVRDEQAAAFSDLAVFVATMRARPSDKQDESVSREMSARLLVQLTRLGLCLAAVLNKNSLDAEVMRRVVRTAIDTARGKTMRIVDLLAEHGREGMSIGGIATQTSQPEDRQRKLLMFLAQLGAAEVFEVKTEGLQVRKRWRLTHQLASLHQRVKSLETLSN